ncbi:MAG: hypothetical protein MJK04_13155, partial [Psychrosphaera sp.]|nr:hypothetical protein [Psychrosphaera sp.]
SSTSDKLGNAYGERSGSFAGSGVAPTGRRMRTLDEMNQYSVSQRRPGLVAAGGELPARSGSTLYHELNGTAQRYLNGQGGAQGGGRGAGEPGTKLRTQLGNNAFSENVQDQTPFQPQRNHMTESNNTAKTPTEFTAFG